MVQGRQGRLVFDASAVQQDAATGLDDQEGEAVFDGLRLKRVGKVQDDMQLWGERFEVGESREVCRRTSLQPPRELRRRDVGLARTRGTRPSRYHGASLPVWIAVFDKQLCAPAPRRPRA